MSPISNIQCAISNTVQKRSFRNTQEITEGNPEERAAKLMQQLPVWERIYRHNVINNYFWYGKAISEMTKHNQRRHRSWYGETVTKMYRLFRGHEDLLNYLELWPKNLHMISNKKIQELRLFIEKEKQEHSEDREVLLGGANVTEAIVPLEIPFDVDAFLVEFSVPSDDAVPL